MRLKQKRLAVLQEDIDKKKQENAELDRLLQESQVMVTEKKNVEELAGKIAMAQNCHLSVKHECNFFTSHVFRNAAIRGKC